jgi:hypothetical protein
VVRPFAAAVLGSFRRNGRRRRAAGDPAHPLVIQKLSTPGAGFPSLAPSTHAPYEPTGFRKIVAVVQAFVVEGISVTALAKRLGCDPARIHRRTRPAGWAFADRQEDLRRLGHLLAAATLRP